MKLLGVSFLGVLGLLINASVCFALPQYLDAVTKQYPKSASPKKFKCAICHRGDPDNAALGPYGLDFSNNVLTSSGYNFKSIENKDSDGDGKTNLEEFDAGTNPGVKGK